MSYYQNNDFINRIPAVTKNILIINAIIWISSYLLKFSDIGFIQYLGLWNIDSGNFFVYQLITYMFVHVEFGHIFFNMFALFMFGSVIERTWGAKRYLIYYLVTGIGAGLIQLLVCDLQNITSFTIGASGAIFGLLLAFGMLFPNTPLYLMFVPVPIKAKYFVLGYGLLEFFFGISNHAEDNVAHFAHLGGMLFGIILILYWRRKDPGNYYRTSSFDKLIKLFKKKPKRMHVQYQRPETDQEYNARKHAESKEIDRILEKIKHSGYNSLNDEEKKKLFDAGKK
jgi:membrane associated rhomboid family serine protease